MSMIAELNTTAEAIQIGRIVCVSGSQIVTLLDDDIRAKGPKAREALQKGRLVKMYAPGATVYGMVNGLSVPVPTNQADADEAEIIEIEVIGEVEDGAAGFERGVSSFPALGDPVFVTTPDDLATVYHRNGASVVRIGSVHQDRGLAASIAPNELLGKHFAVLGTTGSGKSCAVTLVLQALLEHHDNAHIVLLDPHNEYAAAFGEKAELLDPQSLELPFWMLNFEEIEEIILGSEINQDGRAEASVILRDMIVAAKKRHQRNDNAQSGITADTPIPYGLSDLIALVDEAAGRLDKFEQIAPFQKIKASLKTLRDDPRYSFIFGGISVRDNMARVLSKLFRIPVEGKPITIVDLSSVPSEILNVVVAVLGRLTFDLALWSERSVPILLVCEEAHRYAPGNPNLGFEPAKRALARIAKEGRKYGVSLCVVSQRPSELAAEVLSQCNTIFALRMSGERDQQFVRAAMTDTASGLLDFLPSLRNGEAIAVGEGISVPVRLRFDSLPEDKRPRSGTAQFSESWKQDGQDLEFLQGVVERWRHQKN